MSKILIVYSTTDGHTKKICQRILSVAEKAGHIVALSAVEDLFRKDLNGFDKIVVGASIRYGKHNKKVCEFAEQYEKLLENKVSAFFSVNVVARKSDKNTAASNPYLKKFLSKVSWKPDELAVFAGKIDYQQYRLLDRMMIRLIMYLTKGPTHPQTVVEFTNWDQVEQFGKLVCDM